MLIRKSIYEFMKNFGIYERILKIETLQKYLYKDKENYVYCVYTKDKRWVVHIINDKKYTKEIVEKQNRFAMYLREKGIITPQKLICDEEYCMEKRIGELTYLVTVEGYLGREIKNVNEHFFCNFGQLIGRIHKFSETYDKEIGLSIIRNNLIEGNADLKKVFRAGMKDIPITKGMRQAVEYHNSLVEGMKKVWGNLPYGTVHGDLGIYNNLRRVGRKLGVIDYNMSGEEVFLGECIIAFYSSIHKYEWKKELKNINMDKALANYLEGYIKEREISTAEKKEFARVSALFDGLFFCKSLISEWNQLHQKDTLEKFDNIKKYFDPSLHNFF